MLRSRVPRVLACKAAPRSRRGPRPQLGQRRAPHKGRPRDVPTAPAVSASTCAQVARQSSDPLPTAPARGSQPALATAVSRPEPLTALAAATCTYL